MHIFYKLYPSNRALPVIDSALFDFPFYNIYRIYVIEPRRIWINPPHPVIIISYDRMRT